MTRWQESTHGTLTHRSDRLLASHGWITGEAVMMPTERYHGLVIAQEAQDELLGLRCCSRSAWSSRSRTARRSRCECRSNLLGGVLPLRQPVPLERLDNLPD